MMREIIWGLIVLLLGYVAFLMYRAHTLGRQPPGKRKGASTEAAGKGREGLEGDDGDDDDLYVFEPSPFTQGVPSVPQPEASPRVSEQAERTERDERDEVEARPVRTEQLEPDEPFALSGAAAEFASALRVASEQAERDRQREQDGRGNEADAGLDFGMEAEPVAASSAMPAAEARDEGWTAHEREQVPPSALQLELEVRQLRRDIVQLRTELDAQRRDIEKLVNDQGSMRGQIETSLASQGISPEYNEALVFARRGMDVDAIAERCGISLAEAELVHSLAQGGRTDKGEGA